MSFSGISGIDINISHKAQSSNPIEVLFSEEVGWVLEVSQNNVDEVLKTFEKHQAPIYKIGQSKGLGLDSDIIISINDKVLLNSKVLSLMSIWEETSYQLERRQTNVKCAEDEFKLLKNRTTPMYKLSFDPDAVLPKIDSFTPKVRVTVIREEGINGDREMMASLAQAGFEVWDITMQDLLENKITLDGFRGVIFPGGFSYADVLGSAKGWAASLLFQPSIRKQLDAFVARTDTFSLGVCNGCQLMSLLGWIGSSELADSLSEQPNVVLDHNQSERFECRWSTVRIEKSSAIMLKGMENSVMGVWVAHGEGRFTFKDDAVLKKLKERECLPIRYVDDYGKPTDVYPLNPNGSIGMYIS